MATVITSPTTPTTTVLAEAPNLFATEHKVRALDELAAMCAHLRLIGTRVVATGGCFDLLHIGHVRYLQQARSQGDALLVMVNSDRSVQSYKGPERPFVPQEARAALLASLACVDYVVIFDDPTPAATLARLQPAIFCKGADYAPGIGTTPLPDDEQAAIASYGGEIAFLPLTPDNSTSRLVARILAGQG